MENFLKKVLTSHIPCGRIQSRYPLWDKRKENEIMKELNIKEATKRYNNLMWDLCYEHNTIGTRLSENTETWNLRDMVSECQYVLDCCYESGNLNSEGSETINELMEYGYSESEAKEIKSNWLSKTRRLRNFIRAYSPYIKDMKCSMGHCSCYDN